MDSLSICQERSTDLMVKALACGDGESFFWKICGIVPNCSRCPEWSKGVFLL